MTLAFNATSAPLSALQPSQTRQPLSAATVAEELLKAPANIDPAAIYHPSAQAPSAIAPTESIESMIARTQAPDFPLKAERHQNAHQSLKFAFEAFQSGLAQTDPDLAEKKFGFTLEADGRLTALDRAHPLSASELERLNKLLNASRSLQSAASQYREASFDLVAADATWGGNFTGGYILNKNNFASTIDLGALFLRKGSTPDAQTLNGFFSSQLWSKGERMLQETVTQPPSERSAKAVNVTV